MKDVSRRLASLLLTVPLSLPAHASNEPPAAGCGGNSDCAQTYAGYVRLYCGQDAADETCRTKYADERTGFLKRWDEICGTAGSAKPAWLKRYDEQCSYHEGLAGGPGTRSNLMSEPEWAAAGRRSGGFKASLEEQTSYRETFLKDSAAAADLNKKLMAGDWTAPSFEKELARRAPGLTPGKTDANLRVINVIYLYEGQTDDGPGVYDLVLRPNALPKIAPKSPLKSSLDRLDRTWKPEGKLGFLEWLDRNKTFPNPPSPETQAVMNRYLGADTGKKLEAARLKTETLTAHGDTADQIAIAAAKGLTPGAVVESLPDPKPQPETSRKAAEIVTAPARQETLQSETVTTGESAIGQVAQPKRITPDGIVVPATPPAVPGTAKPAPLQSSGQPTAAGSVIKAFQDYQKELYDAVYPVFSREDWRARKAKLAPTAMTPNRVTVHHSAGAQYMDEKSALAYVKSVQAMHMNPNDPKHGWEDIGYHFLIDGAGRVYEGRHADVLGAHTMDNNDGNIGIALMGNFNRDKLTDAQSDSLTRLITFLALKYHADPGQKDFVQPHQHYVRTDCPGRNVISLLADLRRKINTQTQAISAQINSRQDGGLQAQLFLPLVVTQTTPI